MGQSEETVAAPCGCYNRKGVGEEGQAWRPDHIGWHIAPCVASTPLAQLVGAGLTNPKGASDGFVHMTTDGCTKGARFNWDEVVTNSRRS